MQEFNTMWDQVVDEVNVDVYAHVDVRFFGIACHSFAIIIHWSRLDLMTSNLLFTTMKTK